jgi:LmbE family N-acetylglucosaminyl deacetylase
VGVKLFLAPHNDDETLFGAYTILRHQPWVVIVLRSFVEATWRNGPNYHTREKETRLALQTLGNNGGAYEQWPYRDSNPPWLDIMDDLGTMSEDLDIEHVWAPAIEHGGHEHHNLLGQIARDVFPADRVTYYLTYTHRGGKSTDGILVPREKGWKDLKKKALSRYESQIALPETAMHFSRDLEEYYARP